MGGPVRGRGGKKNRKHGRNKDWCQAYKGRGQRERNKKARLERHVARLAKAKDKTEQEALHKKRPGPLPRFFLWSSIVQAGFWGRLGHDMGEMGSSVLSPS